MDYNNFRQNSNYYGGKGGKPQGQWRDPLPCRFGDLCKRKDTCKFKHPPPIVKKVSTSLNYNGGGRDDEVYDYGHDYGHETSKYHGHDDRGPYRHTAAKRGGGASYGGGDGYFPGGGRGGYGGGGGYEPDYSY